MSNAIIKATVTDAYGCVVTCSKAIHAEDVRCFAGSSGKAKVTICHQTGSTKNPCVKICVDSDAVNEHLAHGDFVGNCNPECKAPTSSRSAEGEMISENFEVRAYPNPSSNEFTFEIESDSTEKLNIKVYDTFGRTIKEIRNTPEKEFIFGYDLPRGIYIVMIQQGLYKKTIRLVKN